MINEREIVLEALLLYDKGDEYGDKVLSDVLSKYAYLEKHERGFINRLFDGVIERKITLDYIINQYSSVKVNKQKPVIRTILRMATYQIFYMDQVPDSAAVNEAVKLAKRKKFANLTGFINGVLRNISKNKSLIVFPDKNKDKIKYLSICYSCPEWLCEHYINELSFEDAEKVLKASLDKNRLYGRVNLSRISRSELISKLTDEGLTVSENKRYRGAIEIEKVDSLLNIDAFNDGLFVIQDLSSQLVIGETKINDGALVVDVCASPGGKTLHALDMGARVIARDVSSYKTERIEENIERCGFTNGSVEVRDALDFDEALSEKADVVIADLPCSGLGVIGRKCDIKYRVKEEDLLALQKLQRDILSVVYKYVKKDGTLIFSTCTVDKYENESNVEWILENLPFEQLGEATKLVQGIDDTDGFFISRFIRK